MNVQPPMHLQRSSCRLDRSRVLEETEPQMHGSDVMMAMNPVVDGD